MKTDSMRVNRVMYNVKVSRDVEYLVNTMNTIKTVP